MPWELRNLQEEAQVPAFQEKREHIFTDGERDKTQPLPLEQLKYKNRGPWEKGEKPLDAKH